ncbi:MAG: leucyl aminopeptidase, partial [Planctomycetota bacterium]
IAIVGKTVTFDSGGLSLKSTDDMQWMKGDMGGGAAVLATMWAISRLNFPLRVIGLLPCVENMLSGNSYRIGDIIHSYSGQTIEVNNTDAEGRIILADALTYSKRYSPDAVIDIATLTGACTVALGRHAIGAMSNNKDLIERVRKAGEICHEKIIELPLWEEYEEMLKSQIADMKNLGGREAGAITAGAFLHKFIRDYPWIHLDIAGVAFIDKSSGYRPAGATGAGVRLLLRFLRDYIDDKKGPGAEKISYASTLPYNIDVENFYTV